MNLGIQGLVAPGQGVLSEIPCIFPADQGICIAETRSPQPPSHSVARFSVSPDFNQSFPTTRETAPIIGGHFLSSAARERVQLENAASWPVKSTVERERLSEIPYLPYGCSWPTAFSKHLVIQRCGPVA